MTEWKDIESAPKDGTVIDAVPRKAAYFMEYSEIAWHNDAWCMDFGKEGWVPVRGPFRFWRPQ